jgi:hypothetical protein
MSHPAGDMEAPIMNTPKPVTPDRWPMGCIRSRGCPADA